MDIYLASMPSMTRALAAPAPDVQLTLTVYMYCWGFAQLFAGPVTAIGAVSAFVAFRALVDGRP